MLLGLTLYILLLFGLFAVLPSVNVTVVAGMFVLAGMTNGAYQQIPWGIYPDLMDITRTETGEAIEGAFSAIWLFGQKCANAFAPLILGAILGAFGWAETTQGQAEQPPQALAALHAEYWMDDILDEAAIELSSLALQVGGDDPDLIIRTGGESRLSNFLLYQAAYSELFFTDVHSLDCLGLQW